MSSNRVMQITWSGVTALLSIAVCSLGIVYGQTEVGGATINGSVLDPSSAAVSGAKVKITSSATGYSREIPSSDAGLYTLIRVPVGTYTLTAEKSGFKKFQRENLRLDVGALATVDIKLEIGQATETVSVTGETPAVETSRSSAATSVNAKAVADLPVNGRNFIDFTTLTPGVVRDPTRGGDLSFAGQRGPANTLLVDGGDSNNLFYGQATGRTGFRPYAFSQDAVQEMQVNANTYPAEIGRAGGGAINVVTKSGTNAFHGTAFEFYRDKGMNANTFENNKAGRAKSPYHFNQFGASLGGPVIKNKLFFFGNYDGQRNTSTQIVIPTIAIPDTLTGQLGKYLAPYQLKLNNNVYLAKMDWNISQSDRLTFRYNSSRYVGVNYESNGAASAAEHTGDNKVSTDNIAAGYTKTIGTNSVLDVRFNYVGDKEPGEAKATGPEVVITNGITFGKNNFSPRYTNAYTYQPVVTFSKVVGAHSFKFGGDINVEKVDNFFPGLFAGQYVFANYAAFAAGTPGSFSQAFSGTSTAAPISQPNVNEFAFFAQDSWRFNDKLTINYGVRYDYFSYNQPSTKNNDAGLAAAGYRTDAIPTDHTNLAPRIGLAYKPLKSDRLVVRGGYGIFYGRTPGLLLSTAILQNGIDVRNFTLTSGLPAYPNVLSAAPTGGQALPNIYVTQKDFKTPQTMQYSGQVEMAVAPDYTVTVGYLGVHSLHLARSRDVNLFPTEVFAGALSTGGAISYNRHPGATSPIRPVAGFGRITLFESGADSIYNSVFFQLQKRFSHNFQVLTSYTIAKATDDAPDGTSVVPNNGGDDAKVAQDTLRPNLEHGPGNADIRHRFVFSAVYDVNLMKSSANPFAKYALNGWQLSSIAQMQSGRPYNATVSGDPNNDGNTNNDRVPGTERNSLRGGWLAQWDLRISRDIPVFKERVKLRLLGEAFNITNRANFSAVNTGQYTYSNATKTFTPNPSFFLKTTTFDATSGAYSPRLFQLAAKIIF